MDRAELAGCPGHHRQRPGQQAAVRRWVEPALILVAVALLVWFMARPAVSPQVNRGGVRYQPGGPPLTFNGVRPGDSVRDTEARLGPPNFRNPNNQYQQWEQPLTQIHYDKRGIILEVGGSGTGVFRQGEQELLRCGEDEEAIARAFGPAQPDHNFYRFPLPPFPGTGSWMAFAQVFCGTQQGQKRWVSHLLLKVPEQQTDASPR